MSLSNNVPNASTSQGVNYQLLRLYIDSIPQFSGNDYNTLEIFIEHCESLLQTYINRTNPQDPLNSFLIRAIIGKLNGRALMLIGSRPEIRNWDELKDLLRLSFGDQRNLDCLVQELIALKPHKNESFFTFGQRIQKCRSAVASKLKSMNFTKPQCQFRMENYDELSLKTFIRGLTGRIQDMVRLRNPNSLELAISYVLEEENFLYNQKQYLGNQSSNHSNSNFNRIPALKNTQPNTQNYSNLGQRPSYNIPRQHYIPNNQHYQSNYNPYLRSTFPSQPVQVQPRYLPPHRLPTNKEVFGPPQNVWKPTGQVPQNKPTPMSVSTRNTSAQNNNYTPQQLHYIETENASIPAYNLQFENSFENHDVQYLNEINLSDFENNSEDYDKYRTELTEETNPDYQSSFLPSLEHDRNFQLEQTPDKTT